jgi:hypothetical protein
MQRTSRLIMVAVIATGLAAGCGGSDSAGDTSESSAASSPSDTAASDTAAPDTVPPDSTTADTAASDTVAPGGDADCLVGQWRADAAELQRRFDALAFPLPFTIGPDSYSEASLDGAAFDAASSTSITAEIPGAGVQLTATGSSTIAGNYSVDGNVIVAEVTSETSELGEWSASLNGTPIPLPDAGFGDPPDASFDFNGSTFACTDDTLTFDVIDSQFGTITYTRVG